MVNICIAMSHFYQEIKVYVLRPHKYMNIKDPMYILNITNELTKSIKLFLVITFQIWLNLYNRNFGLPKVSGAIRLYIALTKDA